MAQNNLTITLDKSELIFDIQNKTHLAGRSRRTDTNAVGVSNMQIGDDPEDNEQMLRSIESACQSLAMEVSEYILDTETDISEEGRKTDNGLSAESQPIVIKLKMPSNYDFSCKQTLSTAMHDYIVCNTLAEWFCITNKDEVAGYSQLARNALLRIHKALNKHVKPNRYK